MRKSNSATRVLLTLCTFQQQPQSKIPVEFLFSQLHFNNVTSQAIFKTRNGESENGNGEREAGNGERGTGNGERGTGNL